MRAACDCGQVRILVTGGAGFIGSAVCRQLVAAGHEVRVLDLHPPEIDLDALIGDVRAADTVQRALRGVDAVCHLAAKVGLGVDVNDLPDYAEVNVSGTAVVLAAMARAGVLRLVLASSMVVYGEGIGRCAEHGRVAPGPRNPVELERGQFEAPCPTCHVPLAPDVVPECAVLDPRNGYAASKVAQEHFAGSWARATGGSVSALRFHNVYGPGMPRDTPYAGVAAIFRSELTNGRAPRVFEDGGQRRDFVHVRDVASATVATLEQHDAGVIAVNVGSGTARTVGELASALSVVTGGPAPIVTGQFRLGDVRHITADSTLLRERFAWRPQVEFAEGLADLVAAGD